MIWPSNHPLAVAPHVRVRPSSWPYILLTLFSSDLCCRNSSAVLCMMAFGKDGSLCILLWVSLLFMIFGLSSSSPYQSSPIPTHYYRDLGNWNHHHWDHQAPGRGALRNSLGVLHPKNHLPARSAWDSQRSVKVTLLTSAAVIMHAKSFGFHLFFTKQKHRHIFLCVASISETHTPQRKGLRSSALRPKKQEPAKQTGPVVIETWVPEEELDLWEIRAFSERSAGSASRTRQDMPDLPERLINTLNVFFL